MKRSDGTKLSVDVSCQEFEDYLTSAEFWARWNAFLEGDQFWTGQEAADFVGLPFEFFRELFAWHEMLRLQGKTFEDAWLELAAWAKAQAH